MNAWLEQYLRPWCAMRPRSWAQLLPIAEYAHNSWKHDTLKVTPHKLITGMKPSVNIDLIPDNVPAAQERIQTVRLDAWLGSYRPFWTLWSLLEYYTLLDTSFLLIQT